MKIIQFQFRLKLQRFLDFLKLNAAAGELNFPQTFYFREHSHHYDLTPQQLRAVGQNVSDEEMLSLL